MQQNGMRASTTTLMTQMDAVFQNQGTTIFQHNPIHLRSETSESVKPGGRASEGMSPPNSAKFRDSKQFESEEAASGQNFDIKSVFDDEEESDV